MDILTQAAQFFLSLSFLIILHEMGHFFPARWFKTRIEKFYLFFNPWFSVYKKKRGDTEYGIGWLPLGGYVKISGMIDESMDKEQLKRPPEPYEFRSKPAWQRLIIMVGGVTVNAILGVLIFAMVLFVWGEEILPGKNVKYGITVDSIGMKMGLRDGDMILSIDNEEVKDFDKITYELFMREAKSLQVERGGELVNIDIPKGTIGSLIKSKSKRFIQPRFPVGVKKVNKGSAAEECGLLAGDYIVMVNDVKVDYYHEFEHEKQRNKGQPITLGIARGNDTLTLSANLPENGILGFSAMPPSEFLEFEVKKYNLFASIPAGIAKAYNTFADYVKQIKLLFTSDEIKASESVGGFISIGGIFSTSWDWHRFWVMTAWLSIVLAFMNLLPIPALDGGHVMFLLWEIITGKPPRQKVMEIAQVIGMILLFGLLIFANANDVIKLFR